MKNKLSILCLVALLTMQSCATILGGQKTDHQRHPAQCDQPRRQLRAGFIIADLILFPPGLIIDLLTKKIYKPQPRQDRLKKC